MSVTLVTVPWWKTAPNPACADFCMEDHAADEFARYGGICCRRTIVKTAELEVELASFVGENGEEGVVVREAATISFCKQRNGFDLDVMTPAQARKFGGALHVALDEAAQLAEAFNDREGLS